MQHIRRLKTYYRLAGLFLMAPFFFFWALLPAEAACEVRLTTSYDDEYQPAVSGDKVAYLRNPTSVVNLSYVWYTEVGGSSTRVLSLRKGHAPAISGTDVVWEDKRNDTGSEAGVNVDIYGYPLSSGPEAVVENQGDHQLAPATDGGRTAWHDFRDGDWEIFLEDTDGQKFKLTSDTVGQTYPRIDGDLVVWVDEKYAGGWDEITLYDLSVDTDGDSTPNYREAVRPSPDPAETRITNQGSIQNGPDISGRKIVWTDYRSGPRNVYYYDLDAPVANGTAVDPQATTQYSARISGDLVVWTDWRNTTYPGGANTDIYGKDLSSGSVIQVTTNTKKQIQPDIDDGRVVWADNRAVHWDIYTRELDGDCVPPNGSIKIKNGSTYTKSLSVPLSLSANDTGGSGLDKVRYRNGNSSWGPWQSFASSKSWTLSSGDGTKVVFYGLKDKAGNEKVVSDTIVLDTEKPIARMETPFVSTRISKTSTFKVKWWVTEPSPSSGTWYVNVYYRPSTSSKWRRWQSGSALSGEAYFTGKAGVTYYFRTLAVDNAHNWDWSKTYKTIVPFNEGIYKSKTGFGGYTKSGKSQNFLTSVRYSNTGGNTLTYKLYNNVGIGLVVTKGPLMGKARIYVDGKHLTTVDSYSSKTKARQLIYYKGFPTKGTHELKIVNVGTPGNARFEVDAVVVVR